jgi:hypothetical protein
MGTVDVTLKGEIEGGSMINYGAVDFMSKDENRRYNAEKWDDGCDTEGRDNECTDQD